ncbi:hypothetical protein HNR20_002165 [Micromonospora parathelypteridis]|uniref:Uncharacterized protein n=1 Tax=Micromonospora parathelypteridis TaxID=1839617 RepID=A0A840VYI7_9ACTN|nr:hypothetical protein [Micromonospora parathelypteridis]
MELPVGALPPKEVTDVEIPLVVGSAWSLKGIQFEDSIGRVWIRRERTGLELEFDPLARRSFPKRLWFSLGKLLPFFRRRPVRIPNPNEELETRWSRL